MPQEGEAAPAEGQKPDAPKEGQEPKGTTSDGTTVSGEPKTFDQDYVKTLRSEAAASRKARQDLESKLSEYEERDKSETEKLTGKLTKAEQGQADAEAKLLRYEVATDKEVPSKLVPLLTASSKEDLEAQADLILENAKPADPDFDGGAREPAPEPMTPAQQHNIDALAVLGLKPN